MLRLLRPNDRPPLPVWYPPEEQGATVDVVQGDLGPDDAALIVHLYGQTFVLVSLLCGASDAGSVAAHTLRHHGGTLACTTTTCPRLWPWLLVRAASA